MEPLDVNGRRMPGHSETELPLADPRLSPFFSFGFVLLGELVISDKEGALHRTNRNPVDLKNQPGFHQQNPLIIVTCFHITIYFLIEESSRATHH